MSGDTVLIAYDCSGVWVAQLWMVGDLNIFACVEIAHDCCLGFVIVFFHVEPVTYDEAREIVLRYFVRSAVDEGDNLFNYLWTVEVPDRTWLQS